MGLLLAVFSPVENPKSLGVVTCGMWKHEESTDGKGGFFNFCHSLWLVFHYREKLKQVTLLINLSMNAWGGSESMVLRRKSSFQREGKRIHT